MQGYLTTKQAARRLGILPRSVAGLIGAGRLFAVSLADRWFIPEDEVKRYAGTRRVGPGRPRGSGKKAARKGKR